MGKIAVPIPMIPPPASEGSHTSFAMEIIRKRKRFGLAALLFPFRGKANRKSVSY